MGIHIVASWFRRIVLPFFLSVAGAAASPAFANEMERHSDVDRRASHDQLECNDPIHDVGVVSIDSPPESVYAGSAYPVVISVSNFGGFTETFEANYIFYVDGLPWQMENEWVYELPPGDTVQVTFFTAVYFDSASTSFLTFAWTLLEGDSVVSNDTLGRNHYLYPTGINEPVEGFLLSNHYYLGQNRPNPFSQKTDIEYGIPVWDQVTLGIYDISGRLVRTLTDRCQKPGHYTATWDATDRSGRKVGSGVYFYRFSAGPVVSVKRAVYLTR